MSVSRGARSQGSRFMVRLISGSGMPQTLATSRMAILPRKPMWVATMADRPWYCFQTDSMILSRSSQAKSTSMSGGSSRAGLMNRSK